MFLLRSPLLMLCSLPLAATLLLALLLLQSEIALAGTV